MIARRTYSELSHVLICDHDIIIVLIFKEYSSAMWMVETIESNDCITVWDEEFPSDIEANESFRAFVQRGGGPCSLLYNRVKTSVH